MKQINNEPKYNNLKSSDVASKNNKLTEIAVPDKNETPKDRVNKKTTKKKVVKKKTARTKKKVTRKPKESKETVVSKVDAKPQPKNSHEKLSEIKTPEVAANTKLQSKEKKASEKNIVKKESVKTASNLMPWPSREQ